MIEAIKNRIESLNWAEHTQNLNEKGYVHLPKLLTDNECEQLTRDYNAPNLYRSVINMKRYQFGSGEYKYFRYPLPPIIEELRQTIYPHLASVANEWMTKLKIEKRFPASLNELLEKCRQEGQNRPTPLILKYGVGDWNALHQDLYGEVYFPFQVVFFLTQIRQDYTGGEFVMVENRPRMQSKPVVLQANRAEAVIFTTNFRPVAGSKGYYRAVMRHGVSEVRSGIRVNLGLIFHDAT
ncbi:2OG-Fe(II) oxygenase [Emticicia sp. 17c]|uniref:2OG-Fe(II) oxygenase n=1 Tax=Emticicia sp. 17c TaxID=3127704 RepID=UPI00301D1403